MKLYAIFKNATGLGIVLQSDLKTEKGYINRLSDIQKRNFNKIASIDFIKVSDGILYNKTPYKTKKI
jgi:hypothetical protein